MAKIRGRVRKFGDNVSTDTITPGRILELPMEEIKKHAFEPIIPEFYKTVMEGDIIVAGNNFGCSSSREQATEVVKLLGINFVICKSMARIYFRNCVALGIYPIISKDASEIFREGDVVEVDIEEEELKNLTTGSKTSFQPLSDTPKKIISAGGILPLLKRIINDG